MAKIEEKKAKAIAILFTAFGQGSDAERMATYVEFLNDVPAEILEKACQKVVRECRYLPSIAEILEAAQKLVDEANGTNFKPFGEVWEEILAELGRTYIWDTMHFSRKEIEQLVNDFGVDELRHMETRQMPTIRSQLNKMYDGICNRAKEKRMNDFLLGKGSLLDGSDIRLVLK